MIMHAEARRFEMTAPRLTPFEVGQIVALHRKGYAYRIISESIIRSDPEAPAPSFGAIGQAIRRWEADPSWTGERARGSGRPRALPPPRCACEWKCSTVLTIGARGSRGSRGSPFVVGGNAQRCSQTAPGDRGDRGDR